MRQCLVRLASTGLALGLAHISLMAQLPIPEVELKLRVGKTAGDLSRDLHDGKVFGLGLGASLALSNGAAVTADLGYDYLPGTGFDALPDRNRPIFYLRQGNVISSVTDADGAHRLFVQPAQSFGSFDSRKRSIEGFSLRLGYKAPIPAMADFSWQAGLSLERYKAKSELTGNIVPNYLNAKGQVKNLGVNEYEGWAYSRERVSTNLGGYAGVAYQMQPDFKLEFNIRSIGYRYLDYAPLAYTAQAGRLYDRTGRGFAFEFALAIKL